MKKLILCKSLKVTSPKNISDLSGIKRYNINKVFPINKFIIYINWGTNFDHNNVINKPEARKLAINKIETLKCLSNNNVPVVDWSTTLYYPIQWIENGKKVFCRTLVTAKRGKGIVIASKKEELVKAKLYTCEFISTGEYRIHVAGGKVIDYVIKKKERNGEDYIRNFDGGWHYSHNCKLPKRVETASIKAIKALGLDFGAVDILNNVNDRTCAVLEVNTAPLLEIKKTIEAYSNYFRNL